MTMRGFTCCLAAAVLVALSMLAAAASAAPTEVAGGMFDPRGIAAGPGDRLLVAQAGSGEITKIRDAADDHPDVSAFAQLAPGSPADVVAGGHSTAYVTLGAPVSQLLRVCRGGESSVLADIAAYQLGDLDPDDQADPPFPEESNAFGLARLWGGRFLVTDAANNDLLLVKHNGKISTVARFKPEAVPWPEGVPGQAAGTPFLAEAVPTTVAVGPDGAWYVAELKGFPFPKGGSRIWRIRPGSKGATCDPEYPDRGACRTVATGFTSVIDIAFGKHRELYVLEIVKEGLLSVEVFGAEPIGALWRVTRGSKTELEPGELLAPGGVAVGHHELYVTTGTSFLGEDAGAVVRIDVP